MFSVNIDLFSMIPDRNGTESYPTEAVAVIPTLPCDNWPFYKLYKLNLNLQWKPGYDHAQLIARINQVWLS